MNLLTRKRRIMQHDSGAPSSYDAPSSNGRVKQKTWNAFVVGHPDYVFDHVDVNFISDETVPRDAQFIYKNKPTVILFYSPNFDQLPSAFGTIPILETVKSFKGFVKWIFGKRDKSRTELSGFRYATSEFISVRRDAIEQVHRENFKKTPRQFITGVGEGQIWTDPEDQGPMEFGGTLQLKALIRQQTKGRNSRLMEQIDKTMTKVIIGLVVAIPFAILFIVIGGD